MSPRERALLVSGRNIEQRAVAFGTGGATDVIARIIAASMSQSLGLFGPAKMPREVVERHAMDLNPLSAEAMGALAREQTEVWRRLTREAGIVPE